jgi:hypothetical protein
MTKTKPEMWERDISEFDTPYQIYQKGMAQGTLKTIDDFLRFTKSTNGKSVYVPIDYIYKKRAEARKQEAKGREKESCVLAIPSGRKAQGSMRSEVNNDCCAPPNLKRRRRHHGRNRANNSGFKVGRRCADTLGTK